MAKRTSSSYSTSGAETLPTDTIASMMNMDKTEAQEYNADNQNYFPDFSMQYDEKVARPEMERLEQSGKDVAQYAQPASRSALSVSVSPTSHTTPNTPNGYSYCWRKTQKFFRRAPKRYPRSWGITCHILIPLFLLIIFAGIFGMFLCQFEAPEEFDTNDEILRQRYWMEEIPTQDIIADLTQLPLTCYRGYTNGVELPPPEPWNKTNWPTNSSTQSPSSSPFPVPFLNETVSEPFNSTRRIKEDKEVHDGGFNYTELEDFLELCGQTAEALLHRLLKSEADLAVYTAVQPLTFNWIRCTNATTQEEKIQTAGNQSTFYELSWEMDRARLHAEYLEEFGLSPRGGGVFGVLNTSDAIAVAYGDSKIGNNSEFWIDVLDRRNALIMSVTHATGRMECTQNIPASAWFWFTIMTTVGYGNQAPETHAGKLMVVFLGLLSLLAFGAILAASGSVVKLLYDDFVHRCNFVYLKRASVSCVFWSLVCVFWMFLLGKRTQSWWANRLEIKVPIGASFFFAYISTTTIGLGDYYLQPEAIFIRDVFEFSMLFLIGFVFVSTLLNTLTKVFTFSNPSGLEARLAKTGFMHTTRRMLSSDLADPRQDQAVQMLQDMLDSKMILSQQEEGEDDNLGSPSHEREPERDVSMLAKEVELLELLLSRRRGELLERTHDGLDGEPESRPRTLEKGWRRRNSL